MIKQLLKDSLGLFGLQLYRTPRHLRRGTMTNLSVTVGSFKILMPSNSLLPDMFANNPNYSSELGRLIATTLRKYPDLCLIDVGANFGDSVAIAKSVANIPILCIEGDEHIFPLLEENTKQFEDVTIHKLFLGEKSESLPVMVEKQGWNMTIIPSQNGSSTMLRLTSLDDLLSSVGDVRNHKVLKIDTEGFDCRIIRGSLSYLKAVKPVVTLEYNRDNMNRIGETGIETLSLLREIGYDVILFYDGQGRLVTSTRLSDEAVVQDLHQYANGRDGAIYYYDLCVFHRDDEDIALAFQKAERARLRSATCSG